MIEHCILLNPKDIKPYITKAKIMRLCGRLDEGMDVIQHAAEMYITASICDDTTKSDDKSVVQNGGEIQFYSAKKNEIYDDRRLLIKLPEDIILQKNLIINELAMECAEKGDYIRSIALLNTAMSHTNFTQEILLKSTLLSSLNDCNVSSTCDRIEQVSILP